MARADAEEVGGEAVGAKGVKSRVFSGRWALEALEILSGSLDTTLQDLALQQPDHPNYFYSRLRVQHSSWALFVEKERLGAPGNDGERSLLIEQALQSCRT